MLGKPTRPSCWRRPPRVQQDSRCVLRRVQSHHNKQQSGCPAFPQTRPHSSCSSPTPHSTRETDACKSPPALHPLYFGNDVTADMPLRLHWLGRVLDDTTNRLVGGNGSAASNGRAEAQVPNLRVGAWARVLLAEVDLFDGAAGARAAAGAHTRHAGRAL